MENQEKNEVLSRAVKAGKRTYFFDVKSTRNNDLYLAITESKRKFDAETGSFFYEKHKVFLYKEDFEKFQNALSGVIEFINTGKEPDDSLFDPESNRKDDNAKVNVDFDDLA